MTEDSELGLDTPVAAHSSNKAKQLADAAAVFQDLEFVKQAVQRLLDLIKSEESDSVLVRSLWTAALVAYVRCFGSGKRLGLSPGDVRQLGPEAETLNKVFKDMRDKHVVHSVNPFEQVKVGLVLSPVSAQDRSVEGVASLYMTQISMSEEWVRELGKLATALQRVIVGRAKALDAEVLEEGRTLPIETLYERPRLRVTVPGGEATGIPRE